jgi:hypothetical protein
MDMTFDATFIKLTAGPTIEIAPAVLAARRAIADSTARLATIPDSALESGWRWGDRDDDVRGGFFRCYEMLEEAAADVRWILEDSGAQRAPGARVAQRSTAARWDLHGLLAALDDDDLDRDPGGGEWTIRQTLAHTVNSQRAYAWFTAWWLARAGEPLLPQVPDDALPDFPDEESEGRGSLQEIRDRLDAILDLAMGRLGPLDEGQLAVGVRWSGRALTVGFRLGRWASHLREHTIQVDKTLVMLGRPTTEAERLGRLLAATYGALETEVFGLPPVAVDRAAADGRTAGGVIAAAAERITERSEQIAEAAGAATGAGAGSTA